MWSYFTGTLHLLTSLLLVLTTYKQMCLQYFTQLCFWTFLIWVSEFGLRHKYTSLVRLECGTRRKAEKGRKQRKEAGKCELWLWEMLDIVLVFSFGSVLYRLQKVLDRRLCCPHVPIRSIRCALQNNLTLWGIPSSMYLLFKFWFHSVMLVKEQSVATDTPSSRLA